MNKTQLVEMNIEDLVPADWNYKSDGTSEEITKLSKSIIEDQSAGVVAVRELDDKFEVIDGNHRLEALKLLKWKKVPCENFGSISKAKAITIARRRNHKWFDDDLLAYAELFTNEVLKEYDIDTLQTFMPDSTEEMRNFEKLLEFDWEDMDIGSNKESQDPKPKTITCPSCGETFEQ